VAVDLYERVAEILGRVTAFSGFGLVAGAVCAAIRRDLRPDLETSYGEWAAYSAGLLGALSLSIEISRAI
jgi:hypothetical protein